MSARMGRKERRARNRAVKFRTDMIHQYRRLGAALLEESSMTGPVDHQFHVKVMDYLREKMLIEYAHVTGGGLPIVTVALHDVPLDPYKKMIRPMLRHLAEAANFKMYRVCVRLFPKTPDLINHLILLYIPKGGESSHV